MSVFSKRKKEDNSIILIKEYEKELKEIFPEVQENAKGVIFKHSRVSLMEIKRKTLFRNAVYETLDDFSLTVSVFNVDTSEDYYLDECDFNYYNSDLISIEIEKGFQTDFATIPPFIRMFFKPDGKWAVASIVHDFLYVEETNCPRWIADTAFYTIMRLTGVPSFVSYIFWMAVTFFGWIHYPRKNSLIKMTYNNESN
jgi:hypothetical protein